MTLLLNGRYRHTNPTQHFSPGVGKEGLGYRGDCDISPCELRRGGGSGWSEDASWTEMPWMVDAASEHL